MKESLFISSVLCQFPREKGGLFYLPLPQHIQDSFSKGARSRLIAEFNRRLTLHCGFNSLGNGIYYIMIATRHVKQLKLTLSDRVEIALYEDTSPFGIEVPPFIEALLKTDHALQASFSALTDGKKRAII